MVEASLNIQATLTRFDIRNALPELQLNFLSLWDQVDREAPNNEALTKVRNNLVPLHEALTDVESTHTPPITSSADLRDDTTTFSPFAGPSDKLSPAEATQKVASSSGPAPEPPETHGPSNNSVAVASAVTPTADNVDDSGEPTVPPRPSSVPSAVPL